VRSIQSDTADMSPRREKPSQSQQIHTRISEGERGGIFKSQKQSTGDKKSVPIPDKNKDVENLPTDPKERFLTVLMSIHKAMAGLLKHIEIKLDDKRVLLIFPDTMETVREELLVNSEQLKLLKETAWKAFGPDTEIDLIREKSESKTNPQKRTKQNIPEQVEEILNIFNAKLES